MVPPRIRSGGPVTRPPHAGDGDKMPIVLRRITETGIEPLTGALSSAAFSGNKHVGTWRPVPSEWTPSDIWMDTTNDSTAIVPRHWTGTQWLPAPASVSFTDTFAGSDGAAWSDSWGTGTN